jgi:hypothetical protein
VRSFLDLITKQGHSADHEPTSGELNIPPALIAGNGEVPTVRLHA